MLQENTKPTTASLFIPAEDIKRQYDQIEEGIHQAIDRVLPRGRYVLGPELAAFEEEFAAYVGARHAIAVSSGTAALHLACLVADLKPGEEVIVPSLTFVATANAVRYTGATPVFADIDNPQNFCISPTTILPCLTERCRAIIVMHYGGYACNMPEILKLAESRGLFLIEDAAHAIGSVLGGRRLGTWGRVGCFSLFSNKNMTTGEGGMLVTDDDVIAAKLRLLRSHGMTTMSWDRHQGHAWTYDVTALGYNYRIDEIHSAIGRAQLRKLDQNNLRRREIISQYQSLLQEYSPRAEIPFLDHPGITAGHLFPVLLPKTCNRSRFMENLKGAGIQTSIHYPPIHKFQAYSTFEYGNLQVTEEVASREVTLPLYPALSKKQIEMVVSEVKTALKNSDA